MDLIARLKTRIQTEPTVDLEVCPPIRPRPPVGAADLARAEEKLGFRLPPLVYALYAQVGDGGYGPGYGVIQLGRLVTRAGWKHEAADWPAKYVDLIAWGCLYYSGVDCVEPSSPVYFFNPDRARDDAILGDYLLVESKSLEEYLSAWLDGEDLWKRGTRQGIH
jgi:hypothetical protein